jgi:pilus assembly protein Flp/PilA
VRGGVIIDATGDPRPAAIHHGVISMLARLVTWLRTDEEGQGLAEYALILALIAVIAIVALIFLGGQVSSILSTVGTSI